MTWPALVLWGLILCAAISRGPLILYLFSATVIFGGLTMLPAGLTGGLNMPPQTVCAAVLILKILIRPGNFTFALRHGLDIRKLGILMLLGTYIILTSLLYPRLFAGSVMLYSLNAAANLSFLSPTSANFTQTIYLLISIGMVFVFGVAGRSQTFRRHYMRSVLLAATLLLASGIVDSVAGSLGQENLLAPFHNASYNLLSSEILVGQKRVVGFMPEASIFGFNCCLLLSFLVFNFMEFETRLRRWVLPLVILGILYMTYLSTSSTGYVGLAVLGIVFAAQIITNILLVRIRSLFTLKKVVYAFCGFALAIVTIVVLPASFITHLQNVLNVVLFQKSTSSSYIERTTWTHAGISAFWATDGFGVGIGSVRTSNWFVNFLASTGFIGVILLGLFVARILLPFRSYPQKPFDHLATGLKLSLLPAFAMIIISGTTPDPGVWVMSIFGLLYGLKLRPFESPAHNVAESDFESIAA